MKQTRILMGMPITVEVIDPHVSQGDIDEVYDYFTSVDDKYSTYKDTSEISQINHGLAAECWSDEMKAVFELCEQTKQETMGYFDIEHDGKFDPSGLVKGWAIHNAAHILRDRGFEHYYIDAGGDIQVSGLNADGKPWSVGIRNPFDRHEIIKTVMVTTEGVATSGTAIRGQHVYDPHHPVAPIEDIVSLTVVGPNIYEADRFATAAFAMGRGGIEFIESLDGFEGYMVDRYRRATMTTNFARQQVAR